MKIGLLWWMKKDLACFPLWQLVSLARPGMTGPGKRGEQRGLPGSGLTTPRDAVTFPVGHSFNESLTAVLPWSWVCLSRFDTLAEKTWSGRVLAVAWQVKYKELGNLRWEPYLESRPCPLLSESCCSVSLCSYPLRGGNLGSSPVAFCQAVRES
jgi:hypothetical protein